MGLQMPPFLCIPVSPATQCSQGHLYDPYSLSPHPVPQDRFHYSGPNSATYLEAIPFSFLCLCFFTLKKVELMFFGLPSHRSDERFT